LTSRGVRSRPSSASQSSSDADPIGALGEPIDQRLGHPLELPVAVAVRRRPLHPERPGELALIGGPVDGVPPSRCRYRSRPSNAVQRPGDSPWPERYSSWFSANSRCSSLPADRQLGAVGHHPAASLLAFMAPATHPWCMLSSGNAFGLEWLGADLR